MVNLIERIMGRRQVDAIIRADPAVITLVRRAKVSTPDGGWRWDSPATLPPIEVSIVPAKRRLSEMLVNTELGDVVDYPYVILARWNTDIRRNDRFTWNGDQFEVQSIHIKQEQEVIALVDYYGGANNG